VVGLRRQQALDPALDPATSAAGSIGAVARRAMAAAPGLRPVWDSDAGSFLSRLRYGRADLRSRSLAVPRPGERFYVAAFAWVAYMIAAAAVVLFWHSIIGDAWSRVANAYYVLYSRDPHLAAMGFVWNPLPSIAVLPLLPFKVIWPDMVATGFAGSIVSATCMAGAVYEIHGIAMDWGVRRSARLLVTLLFAFNPMIVYYAANGMSEAMFLVTLIVVARYLSRWALTRQTVPLVVAGIGLAVAYMTRYEAVVAALGAAAVVVLLTGLRSNSGPIRERIAEGIADASVLVAPFGTVFIGWAFASWLIVKDPFQQFTSIYGVVSQLAVAQPQVAAITGQGTSSAYIWITKQILGLEPGILILGLLAFILTFRGRAAFTLPVVATIGGVVAFAIFGFLTGRTLGWLRYSIAVIPLASILALALLAPKPETRLVAEEPPAAPKWRLISSRLMGVMAVAVIALAVPVGAVVMLDPGENPQYGGEAFQLRPVFFPNQPLYANEPITKYTPFGQYQVGRQAATYIDAMHLASGSVLVDGAMGFPIILESANPTQFITTSDRDFQQALLDPLSFHVKYLLVPEAVGYQSLDALNQAYPSIYQNGAGISQLVTQFSDGGNNWRLYRVTETQ
jgi:hypothetical protein